MTTFAKKPVTPQDLLTKLISQNLQIPDRQQALQYINHVGHYRLKGYWFHLLVPGTKAFPGGTSFDTIINRYEFDRAIKSLILDASERLEVAIRNAICNHLALKHTSPHWYLDTALFKAGLKFGFGQMLSKIEQDIARSQEKRFIANYYAAYDDPYLPPCWAMCECVTLGTWSRIFKILRHANDRTAISARFAISKPEVFESWLHCLTVMRNMAAHHDRFLHNKLRVGPSNYKSKSISFSDNKSVYAGLTVIHFLLNAAGFGAPFKQNILDLQRRYGIGLFQELGFPRNWPTNATGW